MKKLRSHSPSREKLSLTERSVLKLLSEQPPLLPSELAAHEQVSTPAMSQILRHLADAGYVARQASTTDKRKVYITLSVAGKAFLQTVRHERDEWLQQALQQSCSAAELAQLDRVLPILAKVAAAE